MEGGEIVVGVYCRREEYFQFIKKERKECSKETIYSNSTPPPKPQGSFHEGKQKEHKGRESDNQEGASGYGRAVHIRTHRDSNIKCKPCASTSQRKSQHGGGEWSEQQLLAAGGMGEGEAVFSESVTEGKVITLQRENTHPGMFRQYKLLCGVGGTQRFCGRGMRGLSGKK